MSLVGDVTTSWFHRAVHLMLVLFTVTFGNFLLRGVTVGLCYINLEKFVSIRMDKDVNFTKPQTEWIQTQEIFSEIKLLRKIDKPKKLLPVLCNRILNSSLWRILYFGSINIGFLLSMTR